MADRFDRCHVGVQKYVKKSFRAQRRALKNSTRRQRRSRSKLRYYANLKHSRRSRTNERRSEDLCASFAVIDFTGMDQGVLSNFSEVQKWQQQEQLAFWKSKALSLEMENKMLLKSLRDVYASNVQNCATFNSQNGGVSNAQNNSTRIGAFGAQYYDNTQAVEEAKLEEDQLEGNRPKPEVTHNKNKQEQKPKVVKLPELPQNRLEDMKRLYGSAAEKIMGMETATQLNYDLHVDEQKLHHWPATGLNI